MTQFKNDFERLHYEFLMQGVTDEDLTIVGKEQWEETQAELERLRKYVDARGELLACYRLGKRPSERLLRKLEQLEAEAPFPPIDSIDNATGQGRR